VKRVALAALLLAVSAHAQFPPAEYQARREALMKAIGPDAIFIALSPVREERFVQERNLLYLTGLDAPDTTLLMLNEGGERREMVFVEERNPRTALYSGPAMSFDAVRARSGIEYVRGSSRFAVTLDSLLRGLAVGEGGVAADYFRDPYAPSLARAIREGRATVWLPMRSRSLDQNRLPRELQFVEDLRRRYPELSFRDATPLLTAQREVKSATEIERLTRAIDITNEGHKAAMRRSLTAANEEDVRRALERTFEDRGATGLGFPSIVATGANATVLHYEHGRASIARDGLMLVDIGAEFEGYSADVTRTFPADGTFSAAQKEIYSAVLAAQNAGFALARPGQSLGAIHAKVEEVLAGELATLGLTSRADGKQARWYFLHPVGHPIGLEVHDVFDRARRFVPGMVVAIEPGVYVRKEAVLADSEYKKLPEAEQKGIAAALERYAGIGVRIEDDVLITEAEPKHLSAAAPRTVAEIESFMRLKP
jgi:Xaa-Pro aminopeptidase